MILENNPKRNFLTETFYIGILTAVGYISAFVFQSSYLSYYGIPTLFIQVDLSIVLFISFLGIIVVFSIFFLIDLAMSHNKKWLWITILISLYEIYVIGMILSVYNVFNFWTFLILYVLCNLPLFFLINKINNSDKQVIKLENKKGLIELIMKEIGRMPVLFFMILFMFIISSKIFGTIYAEYKTNYLFINDFPQFVVISTYGNSLIAVDYNDSTKQIGNQVMLFPNDPNTSKEVNYFTIKNIGRLIQTMNYWY